MLRKTTMIRRSGVLAVTAVLALTACGGDGSSGGDDDGSSGGKKSRRGGGDDDGGKAPAAQQTGPEKLRLGQTARKAHEVTRDNKTGKFKVAVKKVVHGNPGDLAEASSDPKKFEGKIPVWLYVEHTHVGGDAPAEVSMVSDWGVSTAGGERGRPLLMLMGSLPSTPDDCTDTSDLDPFTKGQRETVCQPFVIAEGEKVNEVQLSRGFQSRPTTWKVS